MLRARVLQVTESDTVQVFHKKHFAFDTHLYPIGIAVLDLRIYKYSSF